MADLAGQSSVSFVTNQMDDALRPVRQDARRGAARRPHCRHLAQSRGSAADDHRRGSASGPCPCIVVREDVERGRLWGLPPYDAPPAIDVHVVLEPRTPSRTAPRRPCCAGLTNLIARTPMDDRIYS